MARHVTSQVGEEAWAGLGWTQEPESGRGLFVELHGTSKRCVETAIDSTLDSMKAAPAPTTTARTRARFRGHRLRG